MLRVSEDFRPEFHLSVLSRKEVTESPGQPVHREFPLPEVWGPLPEVRGPLQEVQPVKAV